MPIAVVTALACAACGMGLAYWPVATAVALVTMIVLSALVTGSRGIITSFLIFLLIQDLLQVLAGENSP
jgi:hypothetical protein